ncbi:MAG: bifunctional adenosylcobinamide kinase/adenosylcobinamide-phosphate guanylyltransferase [Firmicutes bacterium]|nr:bifunctional adenosylcobinamide kinase/adenosylcobinamide-phosphate guanylyltransferase [Bacillota bacterium]
MAEGRGRFILVTGGVRSGKSTFAEDYAQKSKKRVVYIATATAKDQEMRRRIRSHRQQRPKHFITREEPFRPHLVIEEEGEKGTFILLDCLTILTSNLLLRKIDNVLFEEPSVVISEQIENKTTDILAYLKKLAALMRSSPADILVVTNEVGMGIVPENPLGRLFSDLAGKGNQLLAAAADEVWLLVCGIPLRIK